ncbi:unnamed protein product [Nyctereutes procyonoides]|uniref:(raccoon dog) hypothetical protein n=1 Tax=Nyctereutes procyonoides TaxID=34880 RepID=A0A811Z5U5_NYCPR|nr:unnamed protein product [Nyctereutes procyonoides]
MFLEGGGKRIDRRLLRILGCSTWEAGGQEAEVFSGESLYGHQRAETHLIPTPMTQGVVSFLATFFTDLMMLDMAMEKYLEEYKVMTEIMLLQVAAGNYNLQPKDPCRASFKSMEWLNKDEK